MLIQSCTQDLINIAAISYYLSIIIKAVGATTAGIAMAIPVLYKIYFLPARFNVQTLNTYS